MSGFQSTTSGVVLDLIALIAPMSLTDRRLCDSTVYIMISPPISVSKVYHRGIVKPILPSDSSPRITPGEYFSRILYYWCTANRTPGVEPVTLATRLVCFFAFSPSPPSPPSPPRISVHSLFLKFRSSDRLVIRAIIGYRLRPTKDDGF